MKNKEYWDNFYNNYELTSKESEFAHYVLDYLKNNKIFGKLIDIGCGNGRDASFFLKNCIHTTGIDLSMKLGQSFDFNFKKENLLHFDYQEYDIFYLRFVLHALTELELDQLIAKLLELDKKKYIFIETRSSMGITDEDKSETFFKHSIGEEHFRMLYSKEYLDKKFSKFNIIESTEGKYSKFGSDDPYCLRFILTP